MMTPDRLSVNTLCFGGGALADHVVRTARLGVGAIGPTVEQVRDHGPAATARLVADAGLIISTLTHRAFGYATPEIAAAERARLDATIAVAEAVGAETITMTTGGRGTLSWPEAAERFAAEIAGPAERARAAGIALSLEPTSHLYADASIAHRLTDTATLARAAGIGVGIDLFACWPDADLEQAIAKAADRIALVQVSDYVAGDRALPCRAVPGDGMVPLGRLIAAIEATGYSGRYDIEVIGPRLWDGDIDDGLRRAIANLGRIGGAIAAAPQPTDAQAPAARTSGSRTSRS